MRTPATLALFAVAPIAVGLALAFGRDPVHIADHRPLIGRQGEFVGSAACSVCHPDQHESWARTFHATMTQMPNFCIHCRTTTTGPPTAIAMPTRPKKTSQR